MQHGSIVLERDHGSTRGVEDGNCALVMTSAAFFERALDDRHGHIE
jgi:hypothetical protein